MSAYDDARREYEAREPDEVTSVSLTREQRDALACVQRMMGEHGVYKLTLCTIGARPIYEVDAYVDGGVGEVQAYSIDEAVAGAIGEAKREASS